MHVVFWIIISTLAYLTYRRVGGDYVWIFVVKEITVTMTLFYAVSWVIHKGLHVGNLYRVIGFYMLGYIWWVSMTYVVCYIVQHHFERKDNYFDLYLNLVLDGGYFGLFTFRKTVELVLDYIFIVTLTVGPKLVKSYVDQSNQKTRLERDNLAMELNFLKSQVSPHFLFNTLNSIYRMSEKGDSKTPDTIYRLSGMMRYLLYEAKDEKLLLQKETQFIEDYVMLVKMRYNDSVRIELLMEEVNEPYRIIPLLLIPFVENAFRHGPEQSRKGTWVRIELRIIDEKLHFHVSNGVNRAVKKAEIGGVGMENVVKRLKLHYAGRHDLQVRETDNAYYVDLEIQL
jgi:two-component system, LytTR family, sensor kinase